MATTRTFQDRDFLVWEVYPSGGRPGFSENPQLIFNCLTQPGLRPRVADLAVPEGDASARFASLSSTQLIELLERAVEIP
jgi:hypothetical protein